MTLNDFKEIQDKNVIIRYLDHDKNEYLEISGIIREVYLAYNPPNLPGSFDFQISNESKQVLQNAKIKVPENIAVLDVTKIELI